MAPNQKAFTESLIRQIQDINGDNLLTAKQKAKAIANLSGAPREDMFEFLNKNFRTGPGLADALKNYVSKDRPRGAPSDSARGTKDIKKASREPRHV